MDILEQVDAPVDEARVRDASLDLLRDELDRTRAKHDPLYFFDYMARGRGWPALQPWQRKIIERMNSENAERRFIPYPRLSLNFVRLEMAVDRLRDMPSGRLLDEMETFRIRDALEGLAKAGMPADLLGDLGARATTAAKASEIWHWAGDHGWRGRMVRALVRAITQLKPPPPEKPAQPAIVTDEAK